MICNARGSLFSLHCPAASSGTLISSRGHLGATLLSVPTPQGLCFHVPAGSLLTSQPTHPLDQQWPVSAQHSPPAATVASVWESLEAASLAVPRKQHALPAVEAQWVQQQVLPQPRALGVTLLHLASRCPLASGYQLLQVCSQLLQLLLLQPLPLLLPVSQLA